MQIELVILIGSESEYFLDRTILALRCLILMPVRLFRVLDDIEMYEEQKLFKLEDYVQISGFLNTFVYKIISNNLIGMIN